MQEAAIDYESFFLEHSVVPFKLTTPYHGIPGKGSAFKIMFEIAKALNVKACAVVDSDLRSIMPGWIDLLIRPVLKAGFDYVAPLYHRHKYDGTITNSIVYPLTRALYGKRIRQPIGGEFGFSGKLAKFYLTKDVWESDVARFGIDIWMTTTAIANNFKICQSFLGAKLHDPKDPGKDLSEMLYQVVGAAFDLVETYSDAWKQTGASEAVPTFGFQYAVGLEPISVDVDRMIEKFRLGVKELMDIWAKVLPEETAAFLQKIVERDKEEFHIADEIWADIIYNFAIAWHKKTVSREHLLKSLTPLYIGKTASFVIENRDSDAYAVEEKIEQLCKVFENKKTFLAEKWQ